jgi:acetoin utilization deacetylase AcuC-like enzyme
VGDRVAVGSVIGDDGHSTGFGHPERPSRLRAVASGLERAGLADALIPLEAQPADRAALVRVHDERYLDALAQLSAVGGGELDPDTPVGPRSFDTAVRGAGLGLAAVDALRRGLADAAFVAPRPPGHHAARERGMGFCLLNNVAVTAAALVAAGDRVVIVDWDVHHGNGTQDVFWDEPAVLYVSLHEWPAYPGTGRAGETGGLAAPGTTVNVPLPSGGTGDVALMALDEVVAPVVERFRPDWLLVSAGFDAHRDDPLAGLAWSAGDYADLTRRVVAYAPAGRTIAFLEGGYDLDALGRSAAATVAALVDVELHGEGSTSGGPGRSAVAEARELRTRAEGGQT